MGKKKPIVKKQKNLKQKIIKNSAYFKKYEVKFKRRRQAKTNYRKRYKMLIQDKLNCHIPKNRLVVRFTNKDIIVQLVNTYLNYDKILYSAYARELKNYGLNIGLTNYAAAYAVGLLIARRIIVSKDLNIEGNNNIDGEYYLDDESIPVILDTGLKRSTLGAKIFAVLKGAVDGGLNIPHSERKFPGYDKKEKEYNPEEHRKRIFGLHIADYIKLLKNENVEKYKKQFNQYIKNNIDENNIEEMYTQLHNNIRQNPLKQEKENIDKEKMIEHVKKYNKKQQKMSKEQKKEIIYKKIKEYNIEPIRN